MLFESDRTPGLQMSTSIGVPQTPTIRFLEQPLENHQATDTLNVNVYTDLERTK